MCRSFLSRYWGLCRQASVHAQYILVCLGPYLGQLCRIRIIEVSSRWVGKAGYKWAHVVTCSCNLMCMCIVFLCYWAHILSQLCQIRVIEVSMRSGGQAWHFLAHIETSVLKLVCMNTLLLRAWAHIWAQLCQIRAIEVSMRPGGHAGHFLAHI